MTPPTLLFVHGWAFDAEFWAPLRAELPDWPHAVGDAGYFGPAATPAAGSPVVAIGHSLGAMHLLREPPTGCAGLIAINGFPRFCAGPDYPAGVPVRMLDRMLSRLQERPDAVTADFRQRCGAEPATAGAARPDPLLRDLQALRDEDLRGQADALAVPLLVLAGDADPIVPPAMTQAAWPATAICWRAGGGHLLPRQDPAWCAARIRDFLRALTP